jgi:hypothetical protein
MMGGLGLSFKIQGFSGEDSDTIRREVAIGQVTREIQRSASGTMLTAQATAVNGPAWDVFQETSADGNSILIWAFQSDAGVSSITVKPARLGRQTRYDVQSADVGPLGTAMGADLGEIGIEVTSAPSTAAHLLILTAQP